MSRLAVVTVVAGRHQHLRAQQAALARSERRPDLVVVVAMGDGGVRRIVESGGLGDVAHVVDVPGSPGHLPLAAARNAGVGVALDQGVDTLILLDVDCLPSRRLVDRYEAAAHNLPGDPLLCGPVGYLPPRPAEQPEYDDAALEACPPHPGRPCPPGDEVWPASDLRLFWSLSFAMLARTWQRIGGFDEAYQGYGAEDTDFGQRAGRAGASMWWVGGAVARHQWHPVSDPPVEHLEDIVRNANLFHRRWGWFPMNDWLDAFEELGLVQRHGARWRTVPPRDAGCGYGSSSP